MATYTVESAGEYVGGRVDDLSAALWGPGYQFLLIGTWTGNNSLLNLYDLGEGAVFHKEQTLDPAIGGNDVALAAPVADRVLFGFKRVPGGKTSFLTWQAGTLAVVDSKETDRCHNSYIAEGTMTSALLDGWWTDAGTFESLHRANK